MIAIIDYGVGNPSSILNILQKIGTDAVISSDKKVIEQADKLILPGVGTFDYGIQKLNEYGFVDLLTNKVIDNKTPILGICLGLQLFTKGSEEGNRRGLGWLDAVTVKFNFDKQSSHLKIPHMGWNELTFNNTHPLFNDLLPDARFYFVHSYHLKTTNPNGVIARAKYGYEFVCGMEKENIVGVQFHPEKSHKFGIQLFKNFVQFY